MDDEPGEDEPTEVEAGEPARAGAEDPTALEADDHAEPDGVDELDWVDEVDDDELTGADDDSPRRTALPRRVESWRTRTATGAVMSAMAMGLQQVFHKEIERPAIVQEAPSDPYGEDDPVVVEYQADDAEGTTVKLRPWLRKGAEG